jgi:hypothetical protein
MIIKTDQMMMDLIELMAKMAQMEKETILVVMDLKMESMVRMAQMLMVTNLHLDLMALIETDKDF